LIGRRSRKNIFTGALVAAALSAVFAIAAKTTLIEGLSFATAYVSVALLAATLSIGPINLMRARPNPVSTHLRRDLGIWAAVTGIAHTLLGLQVHKGGSLSGYFVLPKTGAALPLDSSTVFVAANYMGALATVLFVVLMSLSSDFALRRAGTQRWKSLQRWSYVLAGFVIVHGFLYQLLEERRFEAMASFGILVAGVVLFQIRGIVIARRRATADLHRRRMR